MPKINEYVILMGKIFCKYFIMLWQEGKIAVTVIYIPEKFVIFMFKVFTLISPTICLFIYLVFSITPNTLSVTL